MFLLTGEQTVRFCSETWVVRNKAEEITGAGLARYAGNLRRWNKKKHDIRHT